MAARSAQGHCGCVTRFRYLTLCAACTVCAACTGCAAIAGSGTAASPNAGQSVELAVHGFPAGDHVRVMLSPELFPLREAVVSSSGSVTVLLPTRSPRGSDDVLLADDAGRREIVQVPSGLGLLIWPATMRVQGLR